MAIKLYRCSNLWVKIQGHPCWKVQKALDDQGIEFGLVSDQVNAIRGVFSGQHLQVFTSGAVVCRPTQQEADKYFRYFAVEHRDDGAIDTMLNVC